MSAASLDLRVSKEAYPKRKGLAPNASRYVHGDSSSKGERAGVPELSSIDE
jgi:hypothetical protein